MIELNHVNKHYGAMQVLKNVSGSVQKGEVAVLCGPSGSGKSTLIRTINRLEEITDGSIKIDGKDIHDKSVDVDSLRMQIGFVFQQFNLFPHLSVMDNITLAPTKLRKKPKEEAEARALELLERVGLRDKASSFPGQLSGGQSQRVAIARSLAMDPEVMLFDEPTSALDPEMVNEVLAVMTDLAASDMTMICVTHEMGFAQKVADSVWFLIDGSIVFQGVEAEFFEGCSDSRVQKFLSQIA
jgi:polar amino acid transport system ATP-binding protein